MGLPHTVPPLGATRSLLATPSPPLRAEAAPKNPPMFLRPGEAEGGPGRRWPHGLWPGQLMGPTAAPGRTPGPG